MKASTSGKSFGKLVAEALREATGNNDALGTVSGFAEFGGLQDGVHALFLCGVDEGAGVDDYDVGLGGVVGDLDAVLKERTEHDFGIHEVLGAAQGNEADAERLFCQSQVSSQNGQG